MRSTLAASTSVPRTLAVVALAIALCCGACDVRGEIAVRLDADGSGTVLVVVDLDAAATERLERFSAGTLDEAVRYDDLIEAGWSTQGFVRDADGGARIELSQAFTSPAEAEALVAGLTGGAGVAADLTLARERSWLRALDAAQLTIDARDLSTGLASDTQIVATFTELGVDPAAIDLTLVAEAIEGLTFAGSVSVPGDDDSVEVGFDEVATASARTERFFFGHLVMVLVAGVLGLVATAALVALAVSLVRSRRRVSAAGSIRGRGAPGARRGS